jgi:hypothetical protein
MTIAAWADYAMAASLQLVLVFYCPWSLFFLTEMASILKAIPIPRQTALVNVKFHAAV